MNRRARSETEGAATRGVFVWGGDGRVGWSVGWLLGEAGGRELSLGMVCRTEPNMAAFGRQGVYAGCKFFCLGDVLKSVTQKSDWRGMLVTTLEGQYEEDFIAQLHTATRKEGDEVHSGQGVEGLFQAER